MCVILSVQLFGQSAAEAERLFNKKEYQKAKEIYQALLRNRPNDALNNYRYARCCYELGYDELAIRHFQLSGNRFPLTNLYLGELYFRNYHFQQSVEAYTLYAETLKPNDKKLAEIEALVQKAALGERLMARVENIAIIDSVTVDKKQFLNYYNFSKDIGSLSVETKRKSDKITYEQVTYTTERGDRRYFSDMNGNNTDIFSSFRLLDAWAEPKSLSDNVNSKSNENYPFLMLDGLTLFYASDGEGSLGGYDIFMTRFSPSTRDFLLPENIGFPFNSPYNDYMMVIDEQRNIGWFASDRFLPPGRVTIYSFAYSTQKEYLRTDDDLLLRNVAQLKKFRRAEKKLSTPSNKPAGGTEFDTSVFRFVLNDSIVYTRYEDFKSEKALEKYKDWRAENDALLAIQQLMLQKRKQYDNVDDAENKEQLSNEIVALELEILKRKRQLDAKLIDATNEEIIFLKNNTTSN